MLQQQSARSHDAISMMQSGKHSAYFSAQASQSARPRRTASVARPSIRDDSSQADSEEAIEEDNSDEDFLA